MADVRHDIIGSIRIMCRDNLVLGTWGNVSARDGAEMIITPCGMDYGLLTADDLVRMTTDGQVLEGKWKPSSEWRLHAEIYKARSDVAAVVHTHSVYATAFAVARTPIPAVVEDLVQITGGAVAVAEYKLPGTQELAQSAVAALADRSAVLLASHGLVGVAATPDEALKVCKIVEKTAQATLFARLLGPVHQLSDEDIQMMRSFYLTSYGPENRGEEF